MVPIEEIKEGDLVWAYSSETGDLKLQEVEGLFSKETTTIIYLYIAGEVLEVTPEHPFLVNGEWLTADKLTTYHSLTLHDGTTTPIEKIETITLATPKKVYNFAVQGYNSYFVGDSKVLVHNCEVGFYHVAGKDSNITYVGKGPEGRANISKNQKDGESVTHFATKNGVAGLNKDQTALVMEHLSIEANGKAISQGGTLKNKINSPGAKLYNGLNDAKKAEIVKAYNKIIANGGKKLN